MYTVQLKEFISTGKFGPVELGMTIDRVAELLGKPEGQMDYHNGFCQLQYAYYEFFYLKESQILYGIQNNHLATFPNTKTGRVNNKRDICFTNEKFTIDIWFFKKNRYLTFKEVIAHLEKESVGFTEVKEAENDKSIRFSSGVRMDFDDLSGLSYYHPKTNNWSHADKIKTEEEWVLSGIQFYNMQLL